MKLAITWNFMPTYYNYIGFKYFFSYFFQVDLRHIDEENNRAEVEIGVDLTEFYMSVEWDILEVPAIRNVKYYTCCDEPYLDITFNVTMRFVHLTRGISIQGEVRNVEI